MQSQLGLVQRRRSNAAQTGSQAVGYRLSSDDLSTGLEVRTLTLSALPVEVVAELVRMRLLWEGSETPPAGGPGG